MMKFTVYAYEPDSGKIPDFCVFDNYEDAKIYAIGRAKKPIQCSVWIEGYEKLRDDFKFGLGD